MCPALKFFFNLKLTATNREDEMAALALYLATPSSSYTNGQEIIIDGGFSRVNP